MEILIIPSLIAAFFGTIAMTLSQEIEMRINNRPISHSPAIAAFKVLHLNFDALSARLKNIASYVVHFSYGTLWGFPIALFFLFGVTTFWKLFILQYVVVLLQGWIVIPLLGIAGPPWTWGWKPVLTEMFHKIIYTFVTVFFFFMIL